MRRLTNMAISAKLAVAFASMMLIVAAVGVATYVKLDFLEQSNSWTTHTYQVLESADDVMASMVDQETGVRGFLIAGDAKFLAPYRNGHNVYETAFAKLKQLTSDNPSQQERLDALNRAAVTWHDDIAEREIALMGQAQTREQARSLESGGAGKASMDTIRGKVAEIANAERSLLATRSSEARAAFTATRAITLSGAIATVAAALVAGWALARGIGGPIVNMTETMHQLADGNAEVQVPAMDRQDEVGRMAQAVQVFKDNLISARLVTAEQEKERANKEAHAAKLAELARDFEHQVSGMVRQFSTASTQLESTAQSMTATAHQTNNQASGVAAAAEEVSAGVQTVAAASEQLTASIQEIGRRVSESSRMTAKAVDDARRTDAIVHALADGAQKIGDVVGLITTIAGQTNLLALNATIEAARAGDAGKGFAVVASEVKGLASQTAKATEEIANQITHIQSATREAVAAIQSIATAIEGVSGIATGISAAVDEQAASTAEIARNVQQTAASTQDVTTNIAGVSTAAESTGAAATQVLGSARNLSQHAEQLTGEVNRFLAAVRAA
jgi:methyl-accepting chemotaxis protein